MFLAQKLSPPQRPVFVVGRLGRKKKARGTMVSRALSIFSIIAIFIADAEKCGSGSGSHYGGERLRKL